MKDLKMHVLGGLGTIGMNCMTLSYQNDMVMIDCGLMFSQLDDFGIDFAIPDFSVLESSKDHLKAFLITHGHEDHIGALVFALKQGFRAPIYSSFFTSLMIRERLKEAGLLEAVSLCVVHPLEHISIGAFQIQFVPVNHSIVDASALFIQTPHGKIIHTGDFRIDPTPFIGSMMDLSLFSKAGDAGVLLLMSDSTNVDRCSTNISEGDIFYNFERIFDQVQGLTVVSMFASNVGRMAQVFKLAGAMNKKIILAGRSMEQNMRLAAEASHLNHDLVIPVQQFSSYPREQLIVLSTGSQGEPRSALARIAQGSHPQIHLKPEDVVVMSSRPIPGNEKAVGGLVNDLFRQGAHVLYEAMHDIHASGHATAPELANILERVKPKFFLPVHGEYRHLVQHAKLADNLAHPPQTTLVAANGDTLRLSKDNFKIVDSALEKKIWIEAANSLELSRFVLKERRKLAERGMIIPCLFRSKDDGALLGKTQVFIKGVVSEIQKPSLAGDAQKTIAQTMQQSDVNTSTDDLQEALRLALRRSLAIRLGYKPNVEVVIVDM